MRQGETHLLSNLTEVEIDKCGEGLSLAVSLDESRQSTKLTVFNVLFPQLTAPPVCVYL